MIQRIALLIIGCAARMLDGGIVDIRSAAGVGAEHAETGKCDGEGKSADVGTSCGHYFLRLRGLCPLTVDPGHCSRAARATHASHPFARAYPHPVRDGHRRMLAAGSQMVVW